MKSLKMAIIVVVSLILIGWYMIFFLNLYEGIFSESETEKLKRRHQESEKVIIKLRKHSTGEDVLRESTVQFQKYIPKGRVELLEYDEGAIFVYEDPEYGFTLRYAYGAWFGFDIDVRPTASSRGTGELFSLLFFPTPEWKSGKEILPDIERLVAFFDNHHWKRLKTFEDFYNTRRNLEDGLLPFPPHETYSVMAWTSDKYRIDLAVRRVHIIGVAKPREEEIFRLSITMESL